MARKRNGIVFKKVYDDLKYQIISLKIHPGQMLIESQIAEMFNVSRTPVREAIKTLIKEGLLIEQSGRLYIVELTLEDVKEIYQIREALEGYAVRSLSLNGNVGLLKSLRDIQSRFEKTLDDKKYWDSFRIDTVFHETLVNAAGNKRINELLNNYSLQIGRIRYLTALIPNHMEITISEHRTIVKALEEGNLRAAEKAVCQHISFTLKAIENLLKETGFGDLTIFINKGPFKFNSLK